MGACDGQYGVECESRIYRQWNNMSNLHRRDIFGWWHSDIVHNMSINLYVR